MTPIKTTRLETRLTTEQREQIGPAAPEQASTVVPSKYFDDLAGTLDEPHSALRIRRAAKRGTGLGPLGT